MRTRISQNIQLSCHTRNQQNTTTRNRNHRTPVSSIRPIAYDIKLKPKCFVERKFVEKVLYSSTQTEVNYLKINGLYKSLVKWIGKEIVVPENTTLDNFFTQIVTHIDKLCGKNSWTVHPFNGGETYCIFKFSEYNRSIENGNAMPMEWMARIEDNNYKWAIEKCISYIAQRCQLPICGLNIQDDYYIYAIDSLENRIVDEAEDEEFVKEAKEYVTSYSDGSISKYTTAINKQKVTHVQLDRALDILKEFSDLYEWFKIGIQIANEGHNIYNFMFNPGDPDQEGGRPIMFDNMVGFYWHTSDPVFCEVDEFLNANYNEAGVLSPFNAAIYSEFKSETIKYNDWPLRLYDWHTTGNKLIDKYEPLICTKCQTSRSYSNQPLLLASIKPNKMSIRK